MSIVDLLLSSYANRPRNTIKPKFLVIHWTANTRKGANARANRNYFDRPYDVRGDAYFEKGTSTSFRYASAHYCVDDTEIVRCIPETEMAYHVGANTYYHPTARNSNTIGIEMCVNSDGNFDRMRANTVKLAADICKRHGIDPLTGMVRHYDVTHKDCPRFFVQDPVAWDRFRRDVAAEMNGGGTVKMDKDAAEKVIAVLGALWMATDNAKVRDAAHYAANALRDAAGIPRQ